MGNPAYDYSHRKERANWQALLDAGHPIRCPRCGKPIRKGQPWDLGHVVDLVLGGNPKARRPEHASCNRQAGAVLATHVPPSRPW